MAFALSAAASTAVLAQTAVWVGGGTSQNFTDPTNWSGGVVPPNTGADLLELSVTTFNNISVNTAANVSGIQVDGTVFPQFNFNPAGGTLTIGAMGIVPFGGNVGPVVYLNVPVVLGFDQTWTTSSGSYTGFVDSSAGISGAQTLTIGAGQVYISGTNTYANLVVAGSGTFYPGSDSAAGVGTLTLQDNSTVRASSTVSLPNAVTLGNSVTLGVSDQYQNLTLSGTITAQDGATTTTIAASSSVTLSGQLTGSTPTDYNFAGSGATPVADGGSQLVFTGTVGAVNSITADDSNVILAPVTVNPLTSYAGMAGGFHVSNGGYLGLDGTFTTPGAVSSFFTAYGAGLSSGINGSIGFDNVENPGTPNTFSDPIDLTGFYQESHFGGLGSSTQAILTGSITPTSDHYYLFGGGGGTLTVTSDLEDFYPGTTLLMTQTMSPLTLILQGANNYTGGVQSQGGVLIFDSAVLPGNASISAQNFGYVGYTEVPGLSSSAFISLFNPVSDQQVVIGFDQHTPDPQSPRLIGDTIDLSGFNSNSTVFLGTATAAEFTAMATITPANNNYAFTGVKGGHLTVDTVLTNDGMIPNTLTLGLAPPVESNASSSVVTLTGTNTFTGGTTFNSGTVFINNGSAFGTGPIAIPDPMGTNPNLASYGGTPITITNPISVGSSGSAQGVTFGNSAPTGNDMLILNGVISDYGEGPGIVAIAGPVTLGEANTYSGGTIITGTGSAVALAANPMSFGTGAITVEDDGVIAPSGANVALSNPITLNSSPLTLGQSMNTFDLTLNGVISGNGNLTIDSSVTLNAANTYVGQTTVDDANVIIGSSGSFGTGPVTLINSSVSFGFANPTILDLSGTDPNSAVSLTTGQTLTLETDSSGGNFAGNITGVGTDQVVVTGGGIQQLSGSSTYSGGTTVSAGVLLAGSSGALGTGMVTVASGADLGVAGGATLTVPIALSGNSTLSGNGEFSPLSPLTFSGGNTVMPGNPIYGQYVSTLSFGSGVTFGTGGVYTLNVADASGGPGSGYSTLDINGALTITAAPSSFTISLTSIGPGGGPGLATFNAMQAYSWTILTATSIPLFNAGDFVISTTNFQNSLGTGVFALGQSGNTLTLDFTPVPEPSSWLLMSGGIAGLCAVAWRRRRVTSAGAGCR